MTGSVAIVCIMTVARYCTHCRFASSAYDQMIKINKGASREELRGLYRSTAMSDAAVLNIAKLFKRENCKRAQEASLLMIKLRRSYVYV